MGGFSPLFAFSGFPISILACARFVQAFVPSFLLHLRLSVINEYTDRTCAIVYGSADVGMRIDLANKRILLTYRSYTHFLSSKDCAPTNIRPGVYNRKIRL